MKDVKQTLLKTLLMTHRCQSYVISIIQGVKLPMNNTHKVMLQILKQ